MSRSKAVLIIGGSGFVGSQLALRLRENFKVFATYYRHPLSVPGVTYIPFNLENRVWVKRVIYVTQPDVIVFAAGSNRTDWSPGSSRSAERIHSVGPATVANTVDIMQPKFIYISNSYVFDGSRGNYHETDTVLPTNNLGKAKLGGENIVKSKSLHYVIVRSSPLYGRSSGTNLSFLDRIRMKLDLKERIELPNHELQSFAPIEGFTDLVTRIIDSGVKNKIVHYSGLTKATQFEFARTFAKRFGYDPNLIVAARKPHIKKSALTEDLLADFSLNSTLTMEMLKTTPVALEDGLGSLEKKLCLNL